MLTIKADLSIPVIQYTSVVKQEKEDMRYCTSAAKFERDLRQLIENGYEILSTSKYIAIRNGEIACPEKAVVIVFMGGYEDNYSVAFPILKSLGVPASIFVATELVGMDTHPRLKNFTPHFGWDEAQEMIDSGLVNIYPWWHPFDEGKDVKVEIKRKLELLHNHLHGNGPQQAFLMLKCPPDVLTFMRSLGVQVCITHFLHTDAPQLSLGAAPICEARHNIAIFDTIDCYRDTMRKIKSKYAVPCRRLNLPDESLLYCRSTRIPVCATT